MSQRKYGVLLSYVSIFINLIIGLLFTPFLIHKLGQSEYGLFNIVGSFAAYLVIMDLGLNDSVVRYIVKYRTLKDGQGEENFLAIIFMIYIVISLFVAGCGWLIYNNLPFIFEHSMDEGQLASLQVMFLILLVNATLTILFNPISATMVAYERFVLLRSLEITSHIVATLAICLFLAHGYKAVAVVAVTTFVTLCVLFFKVFYAFYRLKIRLKLHRLSRRYIIEIMKYAAPIFVVVIVEQIYWKLDNIILGAMLGPSLVAIYAIGIMFHKYFMSFSTAISKVMLPKIVQQIESGANATELTDILIKVSRLQAIILMLILSGMILFGKDFIILWVGPDYIAAYDIILLTLIPYSLELIGNIRNAILQAKGLYWYRSIVLLVISLFNIILTIFLVEQWGLIGAAVSTGIGIVLGYVAVNLIIKLKIGIDIGRYIKELLAGILPVILLAVAIGMLINLYQGVSWIVLLLKISFYTLVYIIFIWFLGMNTAEKTLLRSLFPDRWVMNK